MKKLISHLLEKSPKLQKFEKCKTSYFCREIYTKGIVGLDLRQKYDVKDFPTKKLTSDWFTS